MREVAGFLLVIAVLLLASAFCFSSMIWWAVAIALALAGLLFYSGRRVTRDREGTAPADERFDGLGPAPLSPGRWRRIDSDPDDADGASDGD